MNSVIFGCQPLREIPAKRNILISYLQRQRPRHYVAGTFKKQITGLCCLMSFIISPMRLFYLSASNSPMFYDAVLCVSVDSCSTFGCIVPNYTASMHHFRYNVIHDNIEPSSQLPNNFPYLLKNILYF